MKKREIKRRKAERENMKIKKDELPVLFFWKYGRLTGERERAQEYIKNIKEVELVLSAGELFELMEDMLNYVSALPAEEGTDEVEEETREFGYDFFY